MIEKVRTVALLLLAVAALLFALFSRYEAVVEEADGAVWTWRVDGFTGEVTLVDKQPR